MAELVAHFTAACSNVEPVADDVSNAKAAHEAVRDCLAKDEDLKVLGTSTVLIGSYAREVSIRRVKDVDVFTKLDDLDGSTTSTELLSMLETALEKAFKGRTSLQDRSVKVDFDDSGLHVDAVPARPDGDAWQIPDRPTSEGDDDSWQRTNPENLGTKSTEMNARYSGNYVPVVKLIRQTRRANLEGRPGGLFFEVLAYHAFDGFSSDMEEANRPRLYVAALRSIATQLADYRLGADIEDPSMPGEAISIRATDVEKALAASTFATVADRAEEALNADACPAAKIYQELLGRNDDGDWVFEMPGYCNADGTAKNFSTITSGDRHVPAGSERFG